MKNYRPIDMNGQPINELLDPVAPQDAATKNYVDLHAGGGPGGGLDQGTADALYVNVVGDTMQGPLLVGNPLTGGQVANKTYVDAEIAYANRTYTHIQSVLSKVWTVVHNLGKHPIVQAEDSTGTLIIGTVQHLDNNTLTITFAVTMSGRASCS